MSEFLYFAKAINKHCVRLSLIHSIWCLDGRGPGSHAIQCSVSDSCVPIWEFESEKDRDEAWQELIKLLYAEPR